MTMRLMIRGFLGRERKFEKSFDIPAGDLDVLVRGLAEEHARAMAAGELTMIEIEFLDEPDPNQRFFRIGSDPRGMVMPMRIDL